MEEILKENVIIIHGCPSSDEAKDPAKRTYDKHWIPWVKSKLVEHGLQVDTPLMPIPWRPDYESFKKEFDKYFVSENTILIGHSCGCAFLVRWLGETKKKIKKLILVAPWKIPDEDDDFRKNFYNFSIDEAIESRVQEIVMFTSNNEAEDGKKSLEIFHNALSGKIINLENHGHYTFKGMGTQEFPELFEIIVK